MIIISAMTRAHVIGNESGDALPWDVPEEYNQFLDFIKNQTVIMGRKSFEIFAGDMSRSIKFVVSRSNKSYPDATVCMSLADAVEKAQATGNEVYVAGGGTIYEQALPIVDQLYLSYIKGEYRGSTYFPEFDLRDWRVTHRQDHPRFEFVIYQRRV